MSAFNPAEATGMEIAVIGMGGRFPKAGNVLELWNNLRNGVEGVTFFADSELTAESLPDVQNPNFVKAGGVIGNAAHFDAAFFGVNPHEAELMDPQHRIFLECAWEALEDAGYDPETFAESIGIYAGAGLNRYLYLNILGNYHVVKSVGVFQITIGNEKDFLATQVSYRLNLRGPSVSVQTACSTSLVAVHMACQGLISGEADMALAGGVSVLTPENTGYLFEEGSINSPDGHCRPFDAKAAGTLRGNGAGIVVLKRLSDALAARDNILAVIKGSAVNNDGSRKMGYTAPSIDGQARVIMAAQAMAGVSPETIQYVEAHGTGTHLGDPIEMKALSQAFRSGGDQRSSACAVGSLKSNLGHLDTAAGVCGLMKTVLALQHEEIPPTLHFQKPNPALDIESSPFYINAELKPWAKGNSIRRAGVSSFGIGGTNAHVVVEEAPELEASDPGREWKLVVLSAKSESALGKMASNLVAHGRARSTIPLADVAFTLALGRRAHRVRSAVVARDMAEACDRLECGAGLMRGEASEHEPQVIFMFPGQGAQYQAMGAQLYRTEPEFRKTVVACFRLLQPHMPIGLHDLIEGRISESELQQTQITQPALFVIEYSLAQLWMSWGVSPKAMIGHSVGEYVAACLAGVMTLEEALRLIALRGKLMQSLPPGGMLHIRMSEQKVRSLLPTGVDLAVVNGQDLCVAAGPEEGLAKLQEELQKVGASGTRLKTSHAFHSAMTEPILEEFRKAVQQIRLQEPRIAFVSNVTGAWITPEQAQNPDYWVQHLRGTVRFGDGLELLLKQSDSVFLEVGPGKTLGQFVQVASQSRKNELKLRAIISGMSAGTRERPDQGESAGLLESLGRLWTLGVSISWSGFYQAERRRRVSLPTYPFERQEYCLEPGWRKAAVRTDGARHKIDDWFYLPSWKRSLAPAIAPAEESPRAEVKTCILFTDRNSVGNDLGAKLEEEKWQVVWVSAAREFQKIDPLHFAMRPGSEEDWMLLVHELKNVGPQKIAHFWNATAEEDSHDFEERMHRSFYSLLYLAKSIGAQSRDGEISILVVSTCAHAVEGGDRPDPFKAPLLGPCRILPQEFPGIRCVNVDVPLTGEGSSERQRVVEQLLREFRGTSSDPVVAYRGRHRWVQSWESTHIEQDVSGVPLRDNGVYLITGGLGGIGLELADAIASAVNNPRVALLGRTPFPERNQWGSWLLEHVASDPTCEKIRRIQKLEAKGAVVQVVQGDVSSKTDLERIREEIAQRHRKVNGIVHAAGIAGGGLLQLRGRPEAARVLAPKIQGTLYLHELFPDLDFLVLCSSVTAVLGGIGQADYCAANAFMDAFAIAHSEQRNQRILSVNWDKWQEVGMAVHTVVPREWEADLTSSLQEAIKPVEGKAVFEMVLGAGLPQLVVSTHDFQRRVREAQATQLSRAADVKMPGSRYARPDSAGPYEAPNGDLETQLAGIWSELLGIEPVGRNDNFFELGGHSLLAIQLISRVREVFRIEVQMGSVFENTTPASFAQMLLALESQPGEMEQIAQIMNTIGAMSESQLMEALEQGRLGAIQT